MKKRKKRLTEKLLDEEQTIKDTEEKERRKKEAERKKSQKERKKAKIPEFVIEINPKLHNLVDKHVYKYPSKPDGLCQNTSKASSLFSDPRKGKDIAKEEKKYLLKHFEHFECSYEWPHTIVVGGGNLKHLKINMIMKVFSKTTLRLVTCGGTTSNYRSPQTGIKGT